jgi:uncharacterized protein
MTQNYSAYIQKKMLFRPVPLPQDHRFVFDAFFEEVFLETPDGVRLNLLFFPAPEKPAHGLVLYFHGNRDNLQRWGALHRDFTTLGYDFLVPDYRGYGKSGGEPDEQRYFEDALQVYKWARERYKPENIVLYGRSLGSGMAAFLAARVQARMLVLETPFDNIRGLIAAQLRRASPPFEPAFRFPNDEHLRKTAMPVLIFHGTRDLIVPIGSAANLKKCLKPGDLFVTIEGGAHHNLRDFESYRLALRQALNPNGFPIPN